MRLPIPSSRRHQDERGIAMITALLVTMVVLALALTALQLATHSVFSSSYDRKRVQAIAAAEAGVDAVYSQIQNSTPTGLATNLCPNPVTGTMAMSPTATYSATIKYYSGYPPSGSAIDCGDLAGEVQDALTNGTSITADVVSRGTAVSATSVNSVSRTLETQVQLTPLTAFTKAIFSNASFGANGNINHFTLNGNGGPNGNIYTNGDFGCNNNSAIQGNVYAQGGATLSNTCTIAGDLWAANSISMSGSSNVGNNVTSSTGSLTIANPSTVTGNVKVAGTCTGCTGAVSGSIVTGAVSPLPPKFSFPPLEWGTGSSYDYEPSFTGASPTPYTVVTSYTSCSGLPSSVSTPTVFVINGNCSFNSSSFTVNIPSSSWPSGVAFVVNGSITLAQKTVFNNATSCSPTTQSCPFVSFIVPSNDVPGYSSTTACPSPYNTNGQYDFTANNNKSFTGVNVFVYTPCNVNITNNSSNWYGQIYAGGTANIANLYTQGYQQMPLFSATGPIVGFTENIAFLREIVNS